MKILSARVVTRSEQGDWFVALSLTLDRLRRLQATLSRRVCGRDPGNIRHVGFAPADAEKQRAAARPTLPVTAQFAVHRKRIDVPEAARIQGIEPARILERATGRYESLAVTTDVVETGTVEPTGVTISDGVDHATTSLVVRWTVEQPLPPPPASDAGETAGWRWGVLTVSHLFAGRAKNATANRVNVRRLAACGDGPTTISGRIAARGRIPGGPDVALVETGLERLWLSGFLPQIDLPEIAPVSPRDLIRWTVSGTSGGFFASDATHRWRWKTFYPELRIAGLGRLTHVIRYEHLPASETESPPRSDGAVGPFGPGSSGGVLVAGGIPVGIQVAAISPQYVVGYAQSFDASLPWLVSQLHASAMVIVNVL